MKNASKQSRITSKLFYRLSVIRNVFFCVCCVIDVIHAQEKQASKQRIKSCILEFHQSTSVCTMFGDTLCILSVLHWHIILPHPLSSQFDWHCPVTGQCLSNCDSSPPVFVSWLIRMTSSCLVYFEKLICW